MEVDIRDFLKLSERDELVARGILRNANNILRVESVDPLINLMTERRLRTLPSCWLTWEPSRIRKGGQCAEY